MLFARSQENVVDTRVVPLIVVPGIMGTRLDIDGVQWDPDRSTHMAATWAWPNTLDMRKKIRFARTASVLETGTSHTDDERARGWAGLADQFYGRLLRRLQHRYNDAGGPVRAPVYAFGYDWRQNNATSATACRAYALDVMQREGTESLIFVTHSMGGYVVRKALRDDKELGHRTVCVLHVGQPVCGAPVAYRRHLAGVSMAYDGWEMRGLLGGTPEDTLRLFSAMPGAMQLLPNDTRTKKLERPQDRWLRLHRRDGGGTFEIPPQRTRSTFDLYRQGNSPPSIAVNLHHGKLRLGDTEEERDAYEQSRGDAVDHIEVARKFHESLDDHSHRATWTISSTGIETDEYVIFYFPSHDFEGFRHVTISDEEVEMGRTANGDGTVPLWSATGLTDEPPLPAGEEFDPMLRRQHVVSGVQHDTMCVVDVVHSTLFRVLDFVFNAPDATIGGGVRGGQGAFLSRLYDKHFANTQIDRKSAEIELRVAKWYAEAGEDVILLDTRADKKMADLQVNGETVEVKSVGTGQPGSVRSQVLDGFAKASRTVLVRLRNATLSRAEIDEIGAQALADRPGNELLIIEEHELPELSF